MDQQHPQQGFQQFQPHSNGGVNYSMEASNRLPQHQVQMDEQHQQVHHAKRPRDSPTFSDGDGMIHHSFKRLKVADESSSSADSLYSTITNYSSFDSRCEAPPSQRESYLLSWRESQTAGQQSCEPAAPSASYQPINSMLGNLHMMRKQREAQPPAQHPAIDYHPTAVWDQPSSAARSNPNRSKKPSSLRVSSKLY